MTETEKNRATLERLRVLREWDEGAREWATARISTYLGNSEHPATTAAILAHLDSLPAPAGYEIMRTDYRRRYHWLRRLLNKAVASGTLSANVAINARQRQATAYALPVPVPAPMRTKPRRRSRSTSQYEVLIEGTPEAKKRIEDLLAELNGSVQAILATKKG